LELVHRGAYHNNTQSDDDLEDTSNPVRTEFIQLRDIRRIEKDIKAEDIQLDSDDGRSTLLWVKRLRANGYLLGFKSKTDPPPPNSYLAPDVFTLMVQTGWQRKMCRRYSNTILCIDAIHNVTMYENLQLTMLVVRDRWTHGIPVTWMLASKGCQQTIQYFLKLARTQSPLIVPRCIMTDFDNTQINACRANYKFFYTALLVAHPPRLAAALQDYRIPRTLGPSQEMGPDE
jgi:hypothetical protein